MEKKYQIFISSTYEDLKEERRIVFEQIQNLGHIPVGMELFQAGNDSQWTYIKRKILECDYYTAVVAERYGSEKDGKSYTQLEYEFAVENGIPVAAFLLKDVSRKQVPVSKAEPEKIDKINNFRRICEEKLVQYWHDPSELGAKVLTALIELMRENPKVGWVRADMAASPMALAEIARLSEEKRQLQAEIFTLTSEQKGFIVPLETLFRIGEMKKQRLSDNFDKCTFNTDLNIFEIFMRTYHIFSTSSDVYNFGSFLKSSGILIDFEYQNALKLIELFASLRLINVNHVQTESFGKLRTEQRFVLSDYAKDFVVHARISESSSVPTSEIGSVSAY